MAGSTQMPYGNAFIVETPRIDQLGQQLLQRQMQRQQMQLQENKEMEGVVGKELANIRGIDAPDIIDKFQQWKNLRKQLYFDPSVMHDAQKYNQIQMAANATYGDLMRSIKDSTEYNQNVKEFVKERAKNPYAFAPNSGEIMSAAMGTPLAGLQNTKFGDLSDIWGATRRQGPQYDFGKLVRDSAGDFNNQPYTEEKVEPGGLQTMMTPYKFGKSPYQVYSSIMGTLVGDPKAHDSAIAAWRELPQEEKDRVNQAYQRIPGQKWQQMTGSEQPQNLDAANPQNEAEQYASYLSKKYAVENNPYKGTPVPKPNLNAEMQAKQQDAIALEKIKHGDRIDEIYLRGRLKNMPQEQQQQFLNNYAQGLVDKAVTATPHAYINKDGKQTPEYAIAIDPTLRNMFKIGEGKDAIFPDELYTDANGSYMRPIYWKRDENGKPIEVGDRHAVLHDISQPVSRQQFNMNLGLKVLTKSQNAKQMAGGQTLSTNPSDWKKEGNYWRYKDGSLYDDYGNKVK